jgi:hypothetical protein
MTPHDTEDAPPARKRPLGIATAILALVLVAAALSYYVLFVKAPTDLAHNLAKGVREAFHVTPRVIVNQTIVVAENAPIAELATTARDVFVDHTWSHTWLGSTKTIQLQAAFTAKAGFDLTSPFTIAISDRPLRVTATLPPAQILSLEMKSYRVLRDENGWWNRLTEADRETAMRDLHALARRQAEQSDLLTEAQRTAERRLQEIVERNGATLTFYFMDGEPSQHDAP